MLDKSLKWHESAFVNTEKAFICELKRSDDVSIVDAGESCERSHLIAQSTLTCCVPYDVNFVSRGDETLRIHSHNDSSRNGLKQNLWKMLLRSLISCFNWSNLTAISEINSTSDCELLIISLSFVFALINLLQHILAFPARAVLPASFCDKKSAFPEC